MGIPYTLNAGATDLRYDLIEGRRRTTVLLSDDWDKESARKTAQFIADVKGTSGGRVFINEENELFAPVEAGGDWEYRYIGPVGEHAWFFPPPEFPGP